MGTQSAWTLALTRTASRTASASRTSRRPGGAWSIQLVSRQFEIQTVGLESNDVMQGPGNMGRQLVLELIGMTTTSNGNAYGSIPARLSFFCSSMQWGVP